jgi:DNA polymerase elongation subunit (family B)
MNIDIETPTDEGFPDMQRAEVPVTAITMKCRDEYIVLGLKEYESKDPKVKYILCKDEHALLSNFIKVWNMPSWNPDIVTGWNIEFFDIPYLVNRITKLLLGHSVRIIELEPPNTKTRKLFPFCIEVPQLSIG